MATSKTKKIAIARGIGNYLDELARGEDRGWVSLGRAGGATNDPAAVDAYADKLALEAEEITSPLKRLKLVQRVIDLREKAEGLRARADHTSWRDHFVEHAGAWAEDHGVSYAAFREMGVPAKVLKEAGIR
jgi:hypothetical protein